MPKSAIPPYIISLIRHFEDLRDGTHGGSATRKDKEAHFEMNTSLLLDTGKSPRWGYDALHRHLRLLPFSSRSIEDAGRLRGSQGGLMSNRCPITDEIGERQLSVEAGKATQGNCRSCRSLDHCAGSRAGCTQTPEIPEYRRELPVKVPWRSTGAAAACGFLDCRSPVGRRRSGSRGQRVAALIKPRHFLRSSMAVKRAAGLSWNSHSSFPFQRRAGRVKV
jgi:hypothetical protein